MSCSRGTAGSDQALVKSSAPVLFLIFNRPEPTKQTFERIRAAAPKILFVAGDGPRQNVPGDVERVAATQRVVEDVDWPCEVHTLFRESNLGCARAVSSAIDWAFEQVDELIVLEDDCLPSASFLPFCSELLERYREDERVFVISGDNFLRQPLRTKYSYYFSRFNHCWGWATWRRAWSHFDFEMKLWPEIRSEGRLQDILCDRSAEKYWREIFDRVFAGAIDSWAYRWTYSCWVQSGLTILPAVNLVRNIGFGDDATHTAGESRHSIIERELILPLTHPPYVIRDSRADNSIQVHFFGFGKMSLLDRLRRFLRLRI